TLPTGLYFISTPNNNCGGSVQVSGNNNVITYTNTALGTSPCTITVQVSSVLPGIVGTCGTFTNNQSNLSAVTNLNTSGVNAALVIGPGNGQNCPGSTPALTKAFSPNPVVVGTPSTLTFTITGATGSSPQNVNFTDTLPAGLYFVPTPSTNRGGSAAGLSR